MVHFFLRLKQDHSIQHMQHTIMSTRKSAKAPAGRQRAPSRKPGEAKLSRKSPNQARAKLTRLRILEAAREILDEAGIGSLTMREVARVAAVSVGMAYEYFPSKQAILYRIYADRLEGRLEFFDAAFSDSGLGRPFAETFQTFLELQRAAGFPSRLDLELQNAIDRDEQLAGMIRHYEDELSRRYVKILRNYGSKWPEERLHQLANFAHALDNANLKLQIGADKEARRMYGELTTKFFYFIVEHCGAETGLQEGNMPMEDSDR